MRLCVTGGTGFLGNAIAVGLKHAEHIVKTPTRSDIWQVESLVGYDAVIHCAAEIYDEAKMFQSNVVLTHKLLTLAEKAKVKQFIYLGSSSEYGRWDIPLHEGLHPKPTNMYESTKYCGTILCQVSTIPTLVIRPFSVYGPGEPERRFIPMIYNSFLTGKELIVGPGVHDFIYIDDFVEGVKRALDFGSHGILNLGTGQQYSNVEVVEMFELVLGKDINWKYDQNLCRPFDTNNWVCDTFRATKELWWQPTTSLIEGLHKYVQFRTNNQQVS